LEFVRTALKRWDDECERDDLLTAAVDLPLARCALDLARDADAERPPAWEVLAA
jgi:hypothetical protein